MELAKSPKWSCFLVWCVLFLKQVRSQACKSSLCELRRHVGRNSHVLFLHASSLQIHLKNSRKKEQQQRVLDCLKDMQHTQIQRFEDLPQNLRRCFHAAFLPEALRQNKSSGCFFRTVYFHTNPFFHHVKLAKAKHITRQFNPKLFTTDGPVQFFIFPMKKCQPLAVEFSEKPYRGRIGTKKL